MGKVHRWAHLFTFLAQVVLTVLMIILSLLPWGGAHTAVTLVLASIQAVLVVAYPMRLREQRGTNRIVLMAWFLLLFILIILVALDVGSRYLPERPPLSG